MGDEDRDAILRRRNRLVAIALSGLATVGCDAVAGPCLSPPVQVEAPRAPSNGPRLPPEEPDVTPGPCLSMPFPRDEPPAPEPPDEEAAPPRAPRTLGAPTPPTQGTLPPEAAPRVCLSEELIEGVTEPTPQPCLRKS